MKCIIKIGSYQLLLPDDTGVAAILKTLSRGVPCYEKLYCGAVELKSENSRALELSMLYVPDKTVFHAEDTNEAVSAPFKKSVTVKPKQLKNTVLRLLP